MKQYNTISVRLIMTK